MRAPPVKAPRSLCPRASFAERSASDGASEPRRSLAALLCPDSTALPVDLRFLRDLAQHAGRSRTVIVVDEAGVDPPRQYQVRPQRLFLWVGAASIVFGLLLALLVILSPVRQLVYGPDPETLRETARLTALRAAALSDSLELQREYLAVLRATLIGAPDSVFAAASEAPDPDDVRGPQPLEILPAERSADWSDHEPPGLALARLDAAERPAVAAAAEAFLSSLQFPALPPVEGFFARGYDAARGHFGIDLAVEEGTPVRAIGDGYVVFADWTNDGGFTIAVQHADGYLSVYKHNRRLLKRVGDRVRNREAVAHSGNTGEITTGPHLHFELWRNGLAQDPRHYLVGL
jgi:murein DD-endopeptidase MepM/ murein hydrolase activator NlpD